VRHGIPVSNSEIVAVVVPFSTNRPHFAGHAFVRQGSESVEASREIFNELIASQNDKAQRILSEKESQFPSNSKTTALFQHRTRTYSTVTIVITE
jgi:hypothetical protein